MKTFNSEEGKTGILQPVWLWNGVALLGLGFFYCMEMLKTALWFPWALYELMRGNLGPDMRYALLVGSAGTCVSIVMLYYASSVVVSAPISTPDLVYQQNIFFYGFSAFVYLVMGIITRKNTREYDILK